MEVRAASSRGALVALVCALTFGFAWFDMPGHGSAFFGQGAALGASYADGHALFLLGMLAVVAVELACPRWIERHAVAVLLGCFAVGTAALALYCAPVPSGVVAASVVATGFVNVLFTAVVAATLLLRVLDREKVTLAIAVSLAAKTLLAYAADRFLGAAGQTALLVATPAVCVACALAARRGFGVRGGADGDGRAKFGVPLSGLMLGAVLSVAVIFAATRVVSSLGFWGTEYPLTAWGPLPALAITAAYVALCHFTLVKADSRLLFRFLPALLVLFALYAFLYSGLGVQFGLSDASIAVLAQYAELYGQTLMWAVLLLGMRTLAMPPLRVMGVLFGAYTVVELLLQRCLTAASGASLAIVLFAFFAMLGALVWALCHFYGKDGFGREPSLPVARSGEDGAAGSGARADAGPAGGQAASPTEARRALAARYGLSERETEVFLLLAQGRTRKFICDELFISAGTASSYTSRVYEKLGVHSKQELLTLVLEQEQEKEKACGSDD